MTTTATPPQAIQVSVLRWAPPIVHGLVRDLRVRWALEEAGWPYCENVVSPADQASAKYRELQPFGIYQRQDRGRSLLIERCR